MDRRKKHEKIKKKHLTDCIKDVNILSCRHNREVAGVFDSEGTEGRQRRRWTRQEDRKASGLRAKSIHDGEFDPGSERTLAARLKHASRAGFPSLLGMRAADW